VHRFEDCGLRADVRTGRDAEAADKAGAQIADDVAVQVRQDQHVVQLRLLDKLHAHVVDDSVLEGYPTLVLRRDRAATLQEEAVRQLHDVGLVDGSHLAATVGHCVFEGVASDPLRGRASDYLDALGCVRADHVLDAGVQVLGVLADDDQIHVLVAGNEAWDRSDRSQIGV
jgi:hypothetical protein